MGLLSEYGYECCADKSVRLATMFEAVNHHCYDTNVWNEFYEACLNYGIFDYRIVEDLVEVAQDAMSSRQLVEAHFLVKDALENRLKRCFRTIDELENTQVNKKRKRA